MGGILICMDTATTTREEKWVSISEAAEIIGVHPRTVRRYIRDHKLPVSRISTQVVRIRLADIDRFMEKNIEEAVVVPPQPAAENPILGRGEPYGARAGRVGPARFTHGPIS